MEDSLGLKAWKMQRPNVPSLNGQGEVQNIPDQLVT